jgi:hypothetical protein
MGLAQKLLVNHRHGDGTGGVITHPYEQSAVGFTITGTGERRPQHYVTAQRPEGS